ncbi:MAG: universal stress protein E [Verrucomicrobiales bacterium]|jgi:universal stress protein E
MKDSTTILVGIDYSENSENALREASRIANRNDSKLVCLHVIEQEIIDEFRKNSAYDEHGVLDAAVRRLEAYVGETIGAGHDIECRTVVGHPFGEFLAAVDTTDVELLVLGSHGLKKENPRRVGTLATRCIRKAPVDVLLVRARQQDPFRNIVACVDFSKNSIRAAYRAADLAIQDNAPLELIHIYRSPIYAATEACGLGMVLPSIDSKEVIATLRGSLEKLAGEISACGAGLEVRTFVDEHINVSAGIVERINGTEADLVVLGTRGRTGLKGLFIGTTAEHLIHNAPCSALAVKPKGFGKS